MTDLEFFPYHNRHVRFGLDNGTVHSGVLVDSIRHREAGMPRSMYTYIPSRNLMQFREADEAQDLDKCRELCTHIDIASVAWSELLA